MSRISGRNNHALYPVAATYGITEKFDNRKFLLQFFINIYIKKIINFKYTIVESIVIFFASLILNLQDNNIFNIKKEFSF